MKKQTENIFCVFLHLSQFLVVIILPYGIATPILLWFFGKGKSDWVNRHGRVIFNWWISFLIYYVICMVLCDLHPAFIAGAYLALVLLACAVVFPVIAAMRASRGIIWIYPLSFDFFGVKNFSSKKTKRKNIVQEQYTDTHFHADKYQSPSIADKYPVTQHTLPTASRTQG